MKCLVLETPRIFSVVEVGGGVDLFRLLDTHVIHVQRIDVESCVPGRYLVAVYPGPGSVNAEPAPIAAIRPVLFASMGLGKQVDLDEDDLFRICREIARQDIKEGAL